MKSRTTRQFRDGNNTLSIWNTRTGEIIGQPLRGNESSIESIAFSPDGNTIISSSNNSIMRWDAHTGTPKGKLLRGHKDKIISIGFIPNSSQRKDSVRLWNVSHEELLN